MIFNIRRLPTRDIREKLRISRKKLWLIEILSKKFVLLWVSRQYSEIYGKHLLASNKAEKIGLCVPKHLIKVPSWRISILTWQGDEVTKEFPGLSSVQQKEIIYSILDWVRVFNGSVSFNNGNQKFRYLKIFLERSNDLGLDKNLVSRIEKMVTKANQSKNLVFGPGFDDIVLSNFTFVDGEVSLVDLDNFSEAINYYYELGFLMADLEIDYGFLPEQTKTLSETYFTLRHLTGETSKNFYILGRISRYAITALNLLSNRNHSYGFSLEAVLNKISQELDFVAN